MYIHEFEVENLKCFRSLKLDFRREDGEVRRWTTLLGENGLGKSTLLKAMAVPLIWPEAVWELDNGVGDWIKNECLFLKIFCNSNKFFLIKDFNLKSIENLQLKSQDVDGLYAFLNTNSIATLHNFPIFDNPLLIPKAMGYGPFRRLSGCSEYSAKLLAARHKPSSRFVTLFREDAAFSYVESWLKDLHNTAREGDAGSARSLERIRALLADGFFPEPMELHTSAAEVRFSFKEGERLPLEALSDGYRAMMVLGLDLLRGMMESWPEAENPLEMPGVVLIDELDAHLHPRWQRELGLWLQDRFPGLQFIVATHSPFLAQASPPGGNIVLRRDASGDVVAEQHPESVSTWRAEQILQELFGMPSTRSPAAARKAARLHALQRQASRSGTEEQEFQQLRDEFDNSPSLLERPEDRAMMQQLQKLLALKAPPKP